MSMWGDGTGGAAPVPVVPGVAPPAGETSSPPLMIRRPWWIAPALAAMGLVTLASVTLAAWVLAHDPAAEEPPVTVGPTLRVAHEACGSRGDLSDADRTLYLDMKGEDIGSGALSWTTVECYLTELQAPEYIVRHMQSTRALDGRQSGSWETFEASWTYHPDDGLDILVRQVG